MRTLILVSSYHHKNTEKVAKHIATILNARIQSPSETNVMDLSMYDLIGFGSGIYSAMHHPELLDLAGRLPSAAGSNVFLFSTDGMPRAFVKSEKTLQDKMKKDHEALRFLLQEKGCLIQGEFQCPGYNTNSFLRFFHGLNKGRPNEEDLKKAAAFATALKEQ